MAALRTAPLLLLSLLACRAEEAPPDQAPAPAYRTIAELFAGDPGIARGCAPRAGACHHGQEAPDLSSLEALLATIDQPCQQQRPTADSLHDLCEPPGDRLDLAEGLYPFEIGTVRPIVRRGEELPSEWLIGLREPVGALPPRLAPRVLRPGPGGLAVLYDLGAYTSAVTLERGDLSGRTLRLQLPQNDAGWYLAVVLARAGVPGAPGAIRLGDPNGNGHFGADDGGRQVRPGAPTRSYLLRRLYDRDAGGPLMPLGSCCAFGPAALRALWCWVAGLAPDGSNARDPIPYDRCPPLP